MLGESARQEITVPILPHLCCQSWNGDFLTIPKWRSATRRTLSSATPHAPASLNFTMSPLIFTMPFQLPRSDFAVTETGKILAIGRPCLVITNEFPFATWSNNPRHFDLNSPTPMVDSFTPLNVHFMKQLQNEDHGSRQVERILHWQRD